MVATLIRVIGDFDLAEEAVQDAFLKALERWPRDGERILTDGPFAETKEQLGGFYVLDCKDLDEALAWAAKIPTAKSGCVEIRPVIQYD